MRKTTIGGTEFQCVRPGYWVSIDGDFTLSHMLAGTAQQQWELYRSTSDNPFAELIDTALSLLEIVEAFKGRELPTTV
jgi:hypothetical protein